MLARIQAVAELVQQYLDQIRGEHAGVTDGALATYIPELADVDPTGFGLSLSLSDGYLYESGDATVEFTIQSASKPFTYALTLDQIGQDAVDARIGVEPSGEAFNEISVDVATKTPKNPMINAGDHRRTNGPRPDGASTPLSVSRGASG
jgi:glutaminase